MKCGENEGLAAESKSTIDNCIIMLNYKSKQGCPVINMSKFFELMNKYYFLWGAGLIVLGLFLSFFGNKFVNVVIYIMVTIAFFLVVCNMFFNLFMEKVKKEWIQWVFIGLIFVGANFAGWFSIKFRKQGISILAGVAGAMIGFIIARTFAVGSKAAYWTIVASSGGILAVIAYYVEKQTIMFVTAFTGSYFMIRGVSVYAGGFPNEVDLQEDITNGSMDWNSFDKSFYGYLAGIFVLTILSFYF